MEMGGNFSRILELGGILLREGGFLLRTGNPCILSNNENKPRLASAPVLDRIRASTRDGSGSDPN